MAKKVKTEWRSTPFRGVRYRKHKTRRYGVNFDQYFSIRYQADGKRIEEGIGWASEGWTAEAAALELAELKKAHRTGKGKSRLSERREAVRVEKEQAERDALTFGEIFEEKYYPLAEAEKDSQSYNR